jgi:hypothetical protein
MQRQYDIFEILPDESVIWRRKVTGHDKAIWQLQELAITTKNELRVMNLGSNAIIAVINVRKPSV